LVIGVSHLRFCSSVPPTMTGALASVLAIMAVPIPLQPAAISSAIRHSSKQLMPAPPYSSGSPGFKSPI
jgi:hypothetical protein